MFVDVSKSTRARRGEYRRGFETVLTSLPAGTVLLGDGIDKNPLGRASFPIDACFEKASLFGSNDLEVEQRRKAATERALDEFDRLTRKRVRGNAILDSLNLAERTFTSVPTAREKLLIVFSDMVENSSRYRFTPRNLRPDEVEAFIAQERRKERIADLRGVATYVVGAGATKGVEDNPERAQAILGFWQRYLEGTGADLRSYGPALTRFP